MKITIRTKSLTYIAFRDFIKSSADWFVPSLLQMPNLDDWILKMHQNGIMYYAVSDLNIISLIVIYHNKEKHLIYIPYVSVHPDFQGNGISKDMMNYIIKDLPNNQYNILLEVRKDNEKALKLYKKLGFYISEDRDEKLLMRKNTYK